MSLANGIVSFWLPSEVIFQFHTISFPSELPANVQHFPLKMLVYKRIDIKNRGEGGMKISCQNGRTRERN